LLTQVVSGLAWAATPLSLMFALERGMAFGVGGAALLYFEFGGRTSALATLQAVRPAGSP
jgi:hypothetical protein